ncbi:MAG: hypothetical protein M1820_005395 [Bogoriella megaspora]|nr:MAG: hypothetical protein M1820_005395 [Bogoriella megaspora]
MATNRSSDSSQSFSSHPAPWQCKCETYWFILWLPKQLPRGIYDPLEASSPDFASPQSAGDFKSGIGMIQIVRYSETPVGPYDELLVMPGNFKVPGGQQRGKARLRISRIYVSQRETCYAGRQNWNIPKHLARFEFSSPPVAKGSAPSSPLTISVFPPGTDDSTPFFTATLTPMKWVPPIPNFSTKYLPLSTILAQPPLPSGDEAMLCGTDLWRTFKVNAHAKKARCTWIAVAESTRKDQEAYWPATKDLKPWSIGLWLEDATLDFPAPEEFKL